MHYEHCLLCVAGIISLLLCFQFYLSLPHIYTYIIMGTPQESDTNDIKQSLYYSTVRRDWKEVIRIYKEHPEIYATRFTKSGNTALHVAATLGAGDTLVQLIDAMENKDGDAANKALQAKNTKGDTPLHCAAARSSPSSPTMCERIVRIAPTLVGERNNERETPLFLAALHGDKETFLYLHSVTSNLFSSTMTHPWRRKGGETILHCTIQREYFDLALHIIHLYKDQFIATSIDEKGITPIHVLASKPSAFESDTRLRWWTKILYYCMVVEPLKFDDAPIESNLHVQIGQPKDEERKTVFDKAELPKNYHTCHDFFGFLWDLVRRVTWKECNRRNSETEAGDSTTYENSYFPLNYATYFEFFKSSYMYVFGLAGIGLLGIKKIKQKHVWCTQIMDQLVEQTAKYEWTGGSDPRSIYKSDEEQESILNFRNKPKTNSSPPGLTNANGAQQKQQEMDKLEALLTKLLKLQEDREQDREDEEMDKKITALLIAAKTGVIELVKKFLECIPAAIHDSTKENKNILHVAVENRQPHIFKELKNHDLWHSLVQTVDVNGNNVLHLAAKVSKYKPWQIPGSAMQMQWEIKWYQYVTKEVPQHLIFQSNKDDDTPGEIFNESHKELVKESSEWLKSTSQSCSVVAALIAGVSYATSSSVPGGIDDKTGKPIFEGQPAFNIFAITSLVALCFSVTALVMFLAILTSRQQQKDFRRDLPFKLLLGLSSLFVSIASILASFCAAHLFVLNGTYIIYSVICLPVSLYAVAHFPLYLDLLKAILTEVPQPSYKDDDFIVSSRF